jgi:hypothetical protein
MITKMFSGEDLLIRKGFEVEDVWENWLYGRDSK